MSGSSKSWHGRLTAQADTATAHLLASIDIDTALWRYDIAGSLAHAQMLREVGILTQKEHAQLKQGLKAVATDLENGDVELSIDLEDIHMVIESALIEKVGDVGRKLHTGRSRNDQVALDLRLWARDATQNIIDAVRTVQQAMVDLAGDQGNTVWPAYTHLQRAQPIVAGHAMLAYVEMLDRDAERLADCYKRINVSPLGSGAVAGTSIPIDRHRTAALLGFPDITRNSIDATSDRDFLAELCFCCATLAVHLSRWAEDWILYSTSEFHLLTLHDAYCTSSSMMPQKKNADTLELIRGKSANALAQLTGMMTLLKGLPLAYNRDLQDDKRFAFETVRCVAEVLTVVPGIVATATIHPADLREGFLDATALAEYLVNQGVPFRTAHGQVGQIVAAAEAAGKTLSELSLDELQAIAPQTEKNVAKALTAENVVKHYAPHGAGGAKQLKKQLAHWARVLLAKN